MEATLLDNALEALTSTPTSPEPGTATANGASNGPTKTPTFPLRGLTENPTWRSRVFGLTETHPKVEKLARWGEWFVRRSCLNVRDKGTWLVISGPTGVGKTHVADIAVRFFNDWAVDLRTSGVWRADRVPSAVFLDWAKVIRRTEDNDPELVLRDALESQVIVIDDAGAEADRFKSGAGADLLRSFLGDCERKFLLLTTNIPRTEWEAKFGDRVADRLNAAHHHDMTGAPSYRPKLKGAA